MDHRPKISSPVVQFDQGHGCTLVDEDGIEVLDAIAAYGALPFGHNPPKIWAALEECRDRREPSFAQPSRLAVQPLEVNGAA